MKTYAEREAAFRADVGKTGKDGWTVLSVEKAPGAWPTTIKTLEKHRDGLTFRITVPMKGGLKSISIFRPDDPETTLAQFWERSLPKAKFVADDFDFAKHARMELKRSEKNAEELRKRAVAANDRLAFWQVQCVMLQEAGK